MWSHFLFFPSPSEGEGKDGGERLGADPGCSRAYPLPDLPPFRGKEPVSVAPHLGVFSL